MAVAHPDRETVRSREIVGIYLRNCWDARQSGDGHFDPRGCYYRQDRNADSKEDGRTNPNAESTIRRIENSFVCVIEPNHAFLRRSAF
jgi:hypothetical protein